LVKQIQPMLHTITGSIGHRQTRNRGIAGGALAQKEKCAGRALRKR